MRAPRANTGPFASEDEALAGVVERPVRSLDPEAVWLFGSRARGDHRPDSDFDLLVVTRDEDGEAAEDYDRAYAPLLGLGVGCDAVPCPRSVFSANRVDPTSLCFLVEHEGRLLYERR